MSNSNKVKYLLSSAEIIGGNRDIVSEIFLRIPAKPLLKFKCVSKQWLYLISDPEFCISHARRQRSLNPTPGALLLNNYFIPSPKLQLVPLKDITQFPSLDFLDVLRFSILQSCNGLLLCSSMVLPSALNSADCYPIVLPFGTKIEYAFFICNPTTKQFKKLAFPSYYISEGFRRRSFLYLAFDPLKSPFYKVICLYKLDADGDDYEIDVYSSQTESWSQARIPFLRSFGFFNYHGVYCNGAIHWYSTLETSPYFDVESETLKTMPMPRSLFRDFDFPLVLCFGQSCGHLHMIVEEFDYYLPLQFNVLKMASDYSGWSVMYNVDLHSIIPRAISVLSVIQNEKEEEESMVVLLLDDDSVMSYHPSDRTSTKICDLELGSIDRPDWDEQPYYCRDAHQYSETLVCV